MNYLIIFLTTLTILFMGFCIHSYFKNNRLFQTKKNRILGKTNIRVCYYEQEILTSQNASVHFAVPSNIAIEIMESSLLLFYYQLNNSDWHYADGTGVVKNGETKFYMSSSGINFYLYGIDGKPYSGPVITLDKFKLIVVPKHVVFGSGVGNVHNHHKVIRNLGLLLAIVFVFK